MKKIKYLGGGWTDARDIDPESFQLTVGKVYELEHESEKDYLIMGDCGCGVYEYKKFFSIVEDTIHNPNQVEVGKLYESVLSGDNILYMGCQNYDTKEKFLLIVVDETGYGSSSVGVMVSMDLSMPIWKYGFVKKD